MQNKRIMRLLIRGAAHPLLAIGSHQPVTPPTKAATIQTSPMECIPKYLTRKQPCLAFQVGPYLSTDRRQPLTLTATEQQVTFMLLYFRHFQGRVPPTRRIVLFVQFGQHKCTYTTHTRACNTTDCTYHY